MPVPKTSLTLEDMPMQYDHWLSFGSELEANGKWDVAARVFRYISDIFGNTPAMVTREANCLYWFGDYLGALGVLELLTRPTVSSLIIEARCWNKLDKPQKACIIYNKALTILERKPV